MINIGKYIETAINWLTENFAPLFDAINVGIGGFIDGFQNILMWIPFYVTIALLAIYHFRIIADLGNGILERNHADFSIGAFVYHHRSYHGTSIGNMERKQQTM